MLKPRRNTASHRDAFLERYEELHAWAIQMTANDRALAEDLLHDLFILFTLNQPDLSRIENLDNYLYASLRNLHISQLRRATRRRFEQLSVVEYESARMSLHSIAHGRDLIQAQQELRRVCHYACARKETANAASVLLLRFFHGYYPSEIARVICSTRRAVDDRLRAARVEAKAYLENAKSLTFINEPGERVIPEVFPARFARTPGDFLLELQQTIFGSRQGECLSREQIEALYNAGHQAPIQRKRLAHIVSCPTCLDSVNNLLGLPQLAERYPTDTMDKDNKKGGGPPDGSDKGGAIRRSLSEWEREAREVFEHKPQELCVSVNGYLLGSQLIGSELSELTLNVTADERISFCEVFSEQGVRLLMMNVEDLPPNGPGELHQRMELSEARSLESSLLFNNPFPTLHVSYHDPALATAPAIQAEEVEVHEPPIAPDADIRVKPGRIRPTIKKLGHQIPALVEALHARLLNARFWLRPGTVTALVALLLIAVVMFVEFRRTTPVVSAAELLERSSLAEDALASDRNQVLHRTISLEERNTSGDLIAHRRIEVWQSAEREISARRLYDDRGSLLAGDWRRADGVQTLYSHGSRPRIRAVPEKRGGDVAVLGFEDVWQFLPSAKEFASLIGTPSNIGLEERPAEFVITYSRPDGTASGLLRATLVLNRANLRATEQTLTLRQECEVREYRMMEESFERHPPSTVAPAVFEPDTGLLSERMKEEGGKKKPEAESLRPSSSIPLPSAGASVDLEVEVTYLLNQVKANLGEQVSLTRTPEGQLHVQGIVDTDQRKAEILSALAPVMNNSAVKIEVQTVEEAVRRQKRRSSDSVVAGSLTATEGKGLPVDSQLRRYLAARGVSGDVMDEHVREFSNRMIARSRQAMRHAFALKRLAEQFKDDQILALSSDARAKRLSMVREHAQEFERETRLLRTELEPVFASSSTRGSEVNAETEIKSEAHLARAVQRLFALGNSYDKAIGSAFAISSETLAGPTINGPQFWQSLRGAENLATLIQNAPKALNVSSNQNR